MNVLFVNDIPFNPKYGGIERVTDLLAKEFISRGINVYYLTTAEFEVDLLEYEFPARLISLPKTCDQEQYINEVIYSYKIDVVINQKGQFPEMLNILKHINAKLISVIHSQPSAFMSLRMRRILAHNKDLYGYIRFCIRLLCYPIIYNIKRNLLIRKLSWQYEDLIKTSDAVVLLSNKYVDELNSLLKSCKNKCQLVSIPNPNTFPKQNILIPKEKTLLYVGRLSKEDKNPIRLLKIWRKLYRRFNDWDVKIVGEGDAVYEMKLYIDKHKLPRIYFCGIQENVFEYYSKAAFICLTSNIEGWGMALTEGMQCGCIPVTYDSYGAASDIIDNGLNGLLIKPFSIRQYALRLACIMEDEEKMHCMSKEALLKSSEFDVKLVANRWESLLHSVLGR